MAVKKVKVDIESGSSDDIMVSFGDEVNKKAGAKVILSLSEDAEHFEVKDWISTGSISLDYAMSGNKNGGIPVGYVTEIAGEPESGKSLLAWHIIKNAQRQHNAIALYYDVEARQNNSFIDIIGVNREKIQIVDYYRAAEDIFNNIMYFLKKLAESKNPNTYAVIVIDSVAAMSSLEELEKSFGEKTMATKARLFHELFRKVNTSLRNYNVSLIILNQIRANLKMKNPYDDPHVIPLEFSVGHNSSMRLRLFKSSNLKGNDNEVIGHRIRVNVTKNSFMPKHNSCSFPLYEANGIANEQSISEILTDNGVITGSTWKTLMVNGKEYKYQGVKGFRDYYLSDEVFRQFCLDKVDEVLRYKVSNWYDNDIIEEKFDADASPKMLLND